MRAATPPARLASDGAPIRRDYPGPVGADNTVTTLRSDELRYCDYGENDLFATEAGIPLLAALLGIPALTDGAAFADGRVSALAG